jgi:hypothetical protein
MAQVNMDGVQPIEGGTSRNAGINYLPLDSWSIIDSQWGRQVEFVFKDGENAKKCWVQLKKSFENDAAGKQRGYFLGKIKGYVNILAAYVGIEAAEAHFKTCFEEMKLVGFDNESDDSVSAYEEKFLVKIMAGIPANSSQEIPVILHYNDKGYLNIPNMKENGYKLPFGVEEKLVLGKDLVLVKPEDGTQESPEAPVVTETDLPLVDAQGADLPF